jgi:ABC-type transport system involved in multi-copper enzyme maturation permease subunit
MWNIAVNTFREIVRNKFLYMIVFFALIFIIFSLALGKLTIWDDKKVIVDFWLGMIEFFGMIWVLFVWSQLLFKEIEGKTIFLILSKPIDRYEFLLWKFFWFSLAIILILLIQSFVFFWVLILKEIDVTQIITFALIFTIFKLEILLALVFFFSTFMSNILTILVSVMVYLVWHSLSLVLDLILATKNQVLFSIFKGIQMFFPPLQALNIKDVIWTFEVFTFQYYVYNSLYALWYLVIILLFSVLIFNKKSFER